MENYIAFDRVAPEDFLNKAMPDSMHDYSSSLIFALEGVFDVLDV